MICILNLNVTSIVAKLGDTFIEKKDDQPLAPQSPVHTKNRKPSKSLNDTSRHEAKRAEVSRSDSTDVEPVSMTASINKITRRSIILRGSGDNSSEGSNDSQSEFDDESAYNVKPKPNVRKLMPPPTSAVPSSMLGFTSPRSLADNKSPIINKSPSINRK